MKSIIGVTPATDGSRLTLNQAYCNAVLQAGGIPLVLPYCNHREIEAVLCHCDGLLLTGGGDIHGRYFNQKLHPQTSDVYPERDAFEITLCKLAARQNFPMLGICRGMQVINVALGGDIFQHIEGHACGADKYSPVHPVTIYSGTLVGTIYADGVSAVNSVHHQSVNRLGEGMRIAAVAPDGVIEAIEHVDRSFVVGVQWHPELLYETNPSHKELFDQLIERSGKRREQCGERDVRFQSYDFTKTYAVHSLDR